MMITTRVCALGLIMGRRPESSSRELSAKNVCNDEVRIWKISLI